MMYFQSKTEVFENTWYVQYSDHELKSNTEVA